MGTVGYLVLKFSRVWRIDFLRILEDRRVYILLLKPSVIIERENCKNLDDGIRAHTGHTYSSSTLGRFPDLWVRVLAFLFFLPGRNTIVKLYYTRSSTQHAY